MKHRIITGLYLIVGLINFAPLMGVLGASKLNELYGITELSADMLLLMQHRAVLFGIIGGFILLAAFKPNHRPVASIMGMISMISFIILSHLSGPLSEQLVKVYWIDIAAIILLLIAMLLAQQQRTA